MFGGMDIFWENLRMFFYTHKTLFDICFIVLYTIESAILFILLRINPDRSSSIITFFILAFSTTISVERICMQSRYNFLGDNINNAIMEYRLEQKETEKLRIILDIVTKDENSKVYKGNKQLINNDERGGKNDKGRNKKYSGR